MLDFLHIDFKCSRNDLNSTITLEIISTFCIHGIIRGFCILDVNAIGTPEICGEVEQHFDRFCGYY